MGTFADQVSQFVLKTETRYDEAVSAIAIALLTRVVFISPVGNPELWAANAEANLWNRGAPGVNAELRLNPANLTKAGRLKRGKKIQLQAISKPEGYVGGRFRGNWQVTVGTQPTGAIDLIDADGGPTIARGQVALAGFKAGADIFLSNHVPYAVRLEYGWSTQAPAGIVRIAVAEFQQIVDEVVGGLPP